MPIPIPPIDGQMGAIALQLRFERGNQVSCLLIDGALAFEVVVVLGDGEQAFARNIASAQHGFEKGNYVFARLGSAEGNHENGVIGHGRWLDLIDSGVPCHSRRIQLSHVNKFRNLIEALAAAPAERPFVTAWIDEDESETVIFAEFRRRTRGEAEMLRRHGIAIGDRVIIVMPQGIPAMTAFVGAMMLGAVPAFLAYPNFKIEPAKYRFELAGVTANLNAKVVVVDEGFPEEMLSYVSLSDRTMLLRAGLNSRAGVTDDEDKLRDVDVPEAGRRSESLAFIQHSAGTTGLQKAVALTHAAVLRQLEHLALALEIDAETDRIYSWLPLYHDMGLIACFMLPMVCHLPVVMQSPMDWVMQPETTLRLSASISARSAGCRTSPFNSFRAARR